jgi:hypothetical protein
VVPAGLCSRSAGLGCWHQQSSKHFCPVSFNFPRSVSSQRRDHSHTQVESVSSTPFLFILLGPSFLKYLACCVLVQSVPLSKGFILNYRLPNHPTPDP